MRNYNMWPQAHKESYNYTHREDRNKNGLCLPERIVIKRNTKIPFEPSQKYMFRMGLRNMQKCGLNILKVRVCRQIE